MKDSSCPVFPQRVTVLKPFVMAISLPKFLALLNQDAKPYLVSILGLGPAVFSVHEFSLGTKGLQLSNSEFWDKDVTMELRESKGFLLLHNTDELEAHFILKNWW